MQKLAPGEIKILEACQQPRNFTYLQKNILKSYGKLSEYLKNLQKEGLLERDVDTRLYRTTQKGKNALLAETLTDKTKNAPSIPINTMLVIAPSHENSIRLSVPLQFFQKEVPVNGFLYLNEEHKGLMAAIEKELKNTYAESVCETFFWNLGEALCNVYLPQKTQKKRRWRLRKDDIMRAYTMMNVEAVLLLQFNGKAAASQIDWTQQVRIAEQLDKEDEEAIKKLKRLLAKNVDLRDKWLTAHILKAAKLIEEGENCFLSPQEFEKSIVEETLQSDFLEVFSKKEIAGKVRELKESGVISTVSGFLVKVEPGKIDPDRIFQEIFTVVKEHQ